MKAIQRKAKQQRQAVSLVPAKQTQPSTPSCNDTDMGNAERFVEQYGADLKFSYSSNQWLVWDGTRFAIDNTGEIERKAKAFAKSTYTQSATTHLQGPVSLDWARASMSRNHITSMLFFARTEREISVTSEQLDIDPWSFNCKNGTIDLQKGKLREHRRDDLITKLAPVMFNPHAKCPQWDKFLHRIMDGNLAQISFLRRAVGYSLSGVTTENVLFILYGSGRNGKTTFIETISKMFGDYARTAEANLLLERRTEALRNDIARLEGARLIVTSEIPEGAKLDEALVKRLTGQD